MQWVQRQRFHTASADCRHLWWRVAPPESSVSVYHVKDAPRGCCETVRHHSLCRELSAGGQFSLQKLFALALVAQLHLEVHPFTFPEQPHPPRA